MKREIACIYARVSSDRQKADGTISNQVDILPKAIERQGWDLGELYTDDGKSASAGKLHTRGDFLRLIADAGEDKFDIVVVADLDRITRSNNWAELGQIFGPLQDHGKKIWSPGLSEPMKLEGGMSMMMLIVKIIVAFEDNQKRVERFKIGKRQAALRGCHPQGTVPYGLTWRTGARDASGWGTDPYKAERVLEAYRRVAAGETGHQVALDFEARQVPAPNKGRWLGQGMTRLLSLPVYRGVHRFEDVIIPVPRIVDDETWYAVQARASANQKKGIGKPLGFHLCHGLAVCSCGGTMYLSYDKNGLRKKGTKRYRCVNTTHRRKPGAPVCKMPSFEQARTDELIWADVAAFLSQPTGDILAALRGKATEQEQEAQSWASDAERYSAELAELDRRLAEQMQLHEDGFIPDNVMKDRVREVAAKRVRIEAQLKTARDAVSESSATVSAARSLEKVVGELKQLVTKVTPEQKRNLVRMMVERGGIKFDAFGCRVTLVFTKPEAGQPARTWTLRVAV